MFCPKCGNQYEGTPAFCSKCGDALTGVAPARVGNGQFKSARRIAMPVVVALCLSLAIGAWFAGQWNERSLWEPKYDEQQQEYTGLQQLNRDLYTENTRLNKDYHTLEASNNQLSRDYQTLEASNAQLSDENARYLSQYAEYLAIRKEVNSRFGYSCDDRKSFVTSTDADVAARVLAITGGYSSDASEIWSDYDRMYEWVRTNIKYSYDSPVPQLPSIPDVTLLSWREDYWRTPSETLEDKTGDCEDMAILLASMIRNYTQSTYACWVITWNSDGSGHAAVAIPVTGGNLAILDPAGNQTIGFGGHQSISTTTYQWLGKWPSESGIHVSAVFSDTECSTFANTAEFVAWATARA